MAKKTTVLEVGNFRVANVTYKKRKNNNLRLLQVLILSGHDHDQCMVTHESTFGPIKEASTDV